MECICQLLALRIFRGSNQQKRAIWQRVLSWEIIVIVSRARHAGFSKPVRSGAPVLILTGQWDPVTPPSNGDEAARYLPNSKHVVVPSGGHGFGGLDGLECIQKLIDQFVETANAKDLDV